MNNIFHIDKTLLYLNPYIKGPIREEGLIRFPLMANRELIDFAEAYTGDYHFFDFELGILENELVLLIGVEEDDDHYHVIWFENREEIEEQFMELITA